MNKSREELHLEFIRSVQDSLDKSSVFEYTKHRPVDEEVDRVRQENLVVGDLFKFNKRVGRVLKITGSLIDAIDVKTKEEFNALTYRVIKL